MAELDLDALEQAARDAGGGCWFSTGWTVGSRGFEVGDLKSRERICSDATARCAEFIAAANPATILELLARLEAAEKERDALRAEVETTENDAAHQKALAESTLRVAEGGEMMDTQEQHMLLELAARAAGYKVYGNWNPLTNDGDAFRLAVFLFRDIHFWYFDGSVSVGNDLRIVCGDDPCAATRLAIVRAAAEIGRNMK